MTQYRPYLVWIQLYSFVQISCRLGCIECYIVMLSYNQSNAFLDKGNINFALFICITLM